MRKTKIACVFVKDESDIEFGYKEFSYYDIGIKFTGKDVINCNYPACEDHANILDKHYPYQKEFNVCDVHKETIHLIDFDALKNKLLISYDEYLAKKRIEKDSFINSISDQIKNLNRFLQKQKERNKEYKRYYLFISPKLDALKTYCESNYFNYLNVRKYIKGQTSIDYDELEKVLMEKIND